MGQELALMERGGEFEERIARATFSLVEGLSRPAAVSRLEEDGASCEGTHCIYRHERCRTWYEKTFGVYPPGTPRCNTHVISVEFLSEEVVDAEGISVEHSFEYEAER